jgi:hypothetical protein
MHTALKNNTTLILVTNVMVMAKEEKMSYAKF